MFYQFIWTILLWNHMTLHDHVIFISILEISDLLFCHCCYQACHKSIKACCDKNIMIFSEIKNQKINTKTLKMLPKLFIYAKSISWMKLTKKLFGLYDKKCNTGSNIVCQDLVKVNARRWFAFITFTSMHFCRHFPVLIPAYSWCILSVCVFPGVEPMALALLMRFSTSLTTRIGGFASRKDYAQK